MPAATRPAVLAVVTTTPVSTSTIAIWNTGDSTRFAATYAPRTTSVSSALKVAAGAPLASNRSTWSKRTSPVPPR